MPCICAFLISLPSIRFSDRLLAFRESTHLVYTFRKGIIMEINVKEARSRLSALLDEVEQGSEITIVRRGKRIARLMPAEGTGKMLPGLRGFRATIRLRGETLSGVAIRGREAVRY